MEIPNRPRAKTAAGPPSSDHSELPSANIRQLQKWFEQANKGNPPDELLAWSQHVDRVYAKWEDSATLSELEISFLIDAFTALGGTTHDYFKMSIEGALEAGIDVVSPLVEMWPRVEQTIRGALAREEVAVEQCWQELTEALGRLVQQTRSDRMNGRAGNTQTLTEVYGAADKLKVAAKKLSGTPAHRCQSDPELDRTIHTMHNEGKNYQQIADTLNRENPRQKLNKNQVERRHARYREREQKFLSQMLRDMFSSPPKVTPR